jgi:hypothetical protein
MNKTEPSFLTFRLYSLVIMISMRLLERISNATLVVILLLNLSFSNARITELRDRVHILAVDHAFDFTTWTINAVWVKLSQSAISAPRYFQPQEQHSLVREYLQLVDNVQKTRNDINLLYSNPSIKDPATASAPLRDKLDALTQRLNALAPFAEAVLEMQVTRVIKVVGLTSGGQPIPWVLYHTTPLPQDLVISSRAKIEQETSYVLQPDLSLEQAVALENTMDKRLNVSSLVVEIGGLAAYPTMIMRTSALDWLSSTIAHEWVHIYLAQHPLGMNYETTPELRTMNETTASIAGGEIGKIVMQRYYPELLTQDSPPLQLVSHLTSSSNPGKAPPPFNFRAEMHTTRVHADELLALGKIDEAEAYMEQRRKVFWDNGYPIRKLNQAYFAFHGAYADVPGGAAGEDPVGPAVRALRAQSGSLQEFLERISQMTSFAELQKAVGQ